MHLKQLVPEYNPSTQVLEQLLAAVPSQNVALASSRVTVTSAQERLLHTS
jgi:hypothetical protein